MSSHFIQELNIQQLLTTGGAGYYIYVRGATN